MDLACVAPWYETHRRRLPWRGADPWRVLVSEVMLQQTPVTRVLPVYEEWVKKWPSAPSLAVASPSEVLVAWGRLGYPRRARNLHRAAQVIAREHGGAVPSDLGELRQLPGVGEYTARAVAVFGFGRRHAVVDVNVRRVVARALLGIAHTAPSPRLADLVEEHLPTEATLASVVSAGLMELGALVCRPTSPHCTACPFTEGCLWRSSGAAAPKPRRGKPRYEGSDRQARGALLRVLRSGASLGPSSARAAVPDDAQRERCLRSLEADGLLIVDGEAWRYPADSTWDTWTEGWRS